MKITLLGPILTSACRTSLGLDLEDAPPGTAQTPIAPLAAGLRAAGHQVCIVTTDPSIDKTVRIEEDGVVVVYCPLRGAPHYRARTRALDLFEQEIQFLTKAIRETDADIVHAHWTYEFAEAAVRSARPHLVTMHDLGWDCLWQFRDAYRLARLIMKYRTMPRIRHLTVVSPYMVRKARQYGYFGAVDVVPNPVPQPVRPMTPRTLSDLARPRLVTIGNASPLKNVTRSIEAFRRIREQLPAAELHLFGPGLDAAYVAAETNIVGHGDQAHETLMNFLQDEATVAIHPSRLESFGVAVAEAKVRGVPVVAGRRSGAIGYVCDDGVSALVDVEDATEIAEAVLHFLKNAEAYQHARTVSAADVSQRFAPEAVVKMYETSYRKVSAA